MREKRRWLEREGKREKREQEERFIEKRGQERGEQLEERERGRDKSG